MPSHGQVPRIAGRPRDHPCGWSGCPCTNIARARFESIGACYVQLVWPADTAPLYKYLQCVHGAHHHSFVFAGGRFVGDGFALDAERLSTSAFETMLSAAGARRKLLFFREADLQARAAPNPEAHRPPLSTPPSVRSLPPLCPLGRPCGATSH